MSAAFFTDFDPRKVTWAPPVRGEEVAGEPLIGKDGDTVCLMTRLANGTFVMFWMGKA